MGSPSRASSSSESKISSRTNAVYGSGRNVIREPSANGMSRVYLPVSQPPASGLNASNAMPCSTHNGITSRSASRTSSEYSFWTTAIGASSIASARYAPSTFETPIAPITPSRTSSSSADSVAESGVEGSGSWTR